MKTDSEHITLNGFPLRGCWKELASERPERQWHRKKGQTKHSIFKPPKWEFTDYPEEHYRRLARKHKQLRRKT